MTDDKPSYDFDNAHTVDVESSNSDGSQNMEQQNDNQRLEQDFVTAQTGRRRRRVCIIGTFIVLVVAGIIAGVTVSSKNRSNSSASAASSSSTDTAVNGADTADTTEDAISIHEMCTVSAEESYAETTPLSCDVEPFDPQFDEGINSYGKTVLLADAEGNRWAELGNQIHGEARGDLSGMVMSMSCDGSTLAVGAPMNDAGDVTSTENIGQVRVFRLKKRKTSSSDPAAASTELEWRQVGEDIDGAVALDRFGGAVSLSADGTRLAVGAIHNDANGVSSGHVQVYELNEDVKPKAWVELGNVIEGQEEKGYFGRSISLSADGTRLAVGSTGADSSSTSTEDVGKVTVFQLNEDDKVWSQLGQEVYGLGDTDYFGRATALSGDGSTLAVGGYKNDAGVDKEDDGFVRIFRYDAAREGWEKQGRDLRGKEAGDWFGLSVALSYDGRRVVAGAPGSSKRFPPVPGYASVYEQTNSTTPWKQLGGDLEGGYSVGMSFDGSVVALGSYKGYSNGINAGQVKAYRLEGDGDDRVFVPLGQDINGQARSMSGSSVAISSNGMRVASGAPAHIGPDGELEIGAVQVFELCM